MERAEPFVEIRRRAVEYPYFVDRYAESVGCDLRDDRLQSLTHRRRADIHRDRTVGLQLQACILPGPRAAALDKAADGDPVVTAVDQLALQFLLFLPSEFGKAAVESMPIVAAVAFGLGIKIAGLDAGERIRHLSIGDEVAPPHLDAVDAETLGRKLDQPLAEETSLVAAGRAIGSGRRLVGDESRRRKMNVRNAIRAAEKLRDIARRGQPIGADIGAEIDKNVAAQADDRAVALAGALDLTIHIAARVSW